MRSLSIFGATGSIGVNTLDLVARAPQEYRIVALTGGHNLDLLIQQALQFRPQIVVTAHETGLATLRQALAGTGIEVAAGAAAIAEAADRPADWTMSAIVGAAGLVPSLRTVARGGALALANKESLVCAGPLLMATAKAQKAQILPVDSEHSAIFQALTGEPIADVERVVITASGGALRDWSLERMQKATLKDALAHPNWAMGQRITIDSASMFNKALEVIEAREFFGFRPEQIEVLVHPESIIHSLVGFRDGALMAHLGAPDMRHAIGYALHYPKRRHLPVERLDLAKLAQLTFRAPDEVRFPALRLAREVMATEGLAGAAFNAAKEIALDHFIAGRIGFMTMSAIVEETLSQLSRDCALTQSADSLEKVLGMDHLTRQIAQQIALKRAL